jgi:hypothetical protein
MGVVFAVSCDIIRLNEQFEPDMNVTTTPVTVSG